MAHVWADRVAETTTTTGTGALTLAGAITGYFRFSSAKRSDGTSIQIGDTLIYGLEAVDGSGVPTGDSEWGVGTYSALNTLTRTTILGSSNGGSVVTLAAGTKNVWLDDIASTRNTLQQYSGTSEPSAPVEGLIHFAKDFNGLAVPYARGATNRSFALDGVYSGRPTFGRAFPRGGNSTTVDQIGLPNAVYGTSAGATIANTNATTRFARIGLSTTATASTAAGIRDSGAGVFCRGTNALDGFRVGIRVNLETVGNTNCRWFAGLLTSGQAAATFDPAAIGNFIGIGGSSADTTNAKLYNSGGSAVSSIDLGANYPAKTAQGGVFEVVLWAETSASTVKYHIRRLDDLLGIAPTTGALSTNLPAAGTQLFLQATINNNATATASVIGFGGFWQETGIG